MKQLLSCLIILFFVHGFMSFEQEYTTVAYMYQYCDCSWLDCYIMHSANKEKVGRVVFGEASGESDNGKLEVAYTIVNRVNHAGFPNSLNAVVNQTYKSGGKTFHHYNTLDNSGHDKRWEAAKEPGATEHAAYNSAITQAGHALCGTKSDPMNCGPVNFCAKNPCSATNSNKYWCVTEKRKIGSHWFTCIKKKTGTC